MVSKGPKTDTKSSLYEIAALQPSLRSATNIHFDLRNSYGIRNEFIAQCITIAPLHIVHHTWWVLLSTYSIYRSCEYEAIRFRVLTIYVCSYQQLSSYREDISSRFAPQSEGVSEGHPLLLDTCIARFMVERKIFSTSQNGPDVCTSLCDTFKLASLQMCDSASFRINRRLQQPARLYVVQSLLRLYCHSPIFENNHQPAENTKF